MKTIERLEQWRLCDFEPGSGRAAGAEHGLDPGWIPVSAPGDTYLALIEAGRIPHPFRGRHEADVEWVRDREWWWHTRFDAAPPAHPAERLRLVFDGLDTFATIYLDGILLGRADNMFRTYVFDLTALLGSGGTHDLAICFAPTSLSAPPNDLLVWSAFTDRISRSRRNLMRKAQFGWGWDWGPDLPTIGIWQPVRLERCSGAVLTDINFTTRTVSEHRADASVSLGIGGSVDGLRAEVSVSEPGGLEILSKAVAATDGTVIDLEIPEPRLWWTADLGEPALYRLQVRLFDGDTLLDEKSRRVGLRTLSLDRSSDPEEPGTEFFRFVLNGVPIFAKGACWIPASSFVAEIGADRYRDLLQRAAGANMNMIRIWGGGIYEPDIFYDLCDELGLLVWQDFMFACAPYPEADQAFVDSVRQEIEDQIRRLRGHACLALWCGNNESQALHYFNARVTGDTAPLPGTQLYDRLMPELVGQLDPDTPYWPGSPWGGSSPNSMRAGDVHDWTVWHGVPPVPDRDPVGDFDRSPAGVAFTRYAEDQARFVSEFGIQAAPALATLRRWLEPADLEPESEGFLLRVKDKPEKARAMMLPETGAPATLDEYVDFSMWTQAEGLKFGIEHFRRRKPHCSGALIWQFNDCWPCVSWSLVDYDGVAKASYYAVTRAFTPVLASFKALGDDFFELWITNDRLAPIHGSAIVELAKLDGTVAWREEVAFAVPANGNACIWRRDVQGGADRLLTVRAADQLFPANRQLLAPIVKMPLSMGARPVVTITQTGPGVLQAELVADHFLAFVHLVSARADLVFSDNYFDMVAGERRTIIVRGPADLAADAIEIRYWNQRLPVVVQDIH